jgi:tetratricopeptide (TPR) repeat protein
MKKISLFPAAILLCFVMTMCAQSARIRLFNGKRLFDQGNYDGAVQELNEAVRLDPNLAEAYAYRARAYSVSDNDRALLDAEKAIQLDPRLALGYFARGNAYINKKDYDHAIADYNEAIRLDHKFATAYANRGLAYSNKNDYDRAIADYTEAIKLNPQYTNAYINRGVAYANKNDYDSAIADYEAALKIDPNHSLARDNLAIANQQVEAEKSQKAAEEANSNDSGKFILAPSGFSPANYTKADLFDAVAASERLQAYLDPGTYEEFDIFGVYSRNFSSDVVFVSQNGTDITFRTEDNAIRKSMKVDSRTGLTSGQKVRIYYRAYRIQDWRVAAIERL